MDASKCLICQRVAKKLARGLCERHYAQYNRSIVNMTEEQRLLWDKFLISRKKLAPDKSSGPRDGNAFGEDLKEFLKTHSPINPQEHESGLVDPETGKPMTAEDIDREIAKDAPKPNSRKKSSGKSESKRRKSS